VCEDTIKKEGFPFQRKLSNQSTFPKRNEQFSDAYTAGEFAMDKEKKQYLE
jgi:hypothetical protein